MNDKSKVKAKVFATMAGCGIICGVMMWIAVGGLGMPVNEEFIQYLVGGIMGGFVTGALMYILG